MPECPTPQKLTWPEDDEWGPWEKMTELNLMNFRRGDGVLLEVYTCPVGGHYHLRTIGKRQARIRAAAMTPEQEHKEMIKKRRSARDVARQMARDAARRTGRRP